MSCLKKKKIEKRSPQNFETGSHDKIIVIKELWGFCLDFKKNHI